MIAGQESRRAVASAGDRVLLIRPDGHEATGREVGARTTGLALALSQHGLAGQRIGLWSWNSAAAIEAHLAAEWIGATRVPVDPGAPPAEAAAVFKAAGVAGVVVDTTHAADAPPGALVHDDDSPLSAAGTLEAHEVQPDHDPPALPEDGRRRPVPGRAHVVRELGRLHVGQRRALPGRPLR